MEKISKEKVKDNQWWFSGSPLRPCVETFPFIELIIEGRLCALQRSSPGGDGRATFSFRFVRDDDRLFWRHLNGQVVEIEFIGGSHHQPVQEIDIEDEHFCSEMAQSKGGDHCGKSHHEITQQVPGPGRKTLFDAYLFADWSANSRPKTGRDSIWIASGQRVGPNLELREWEGGAINPATRHQARELMTGILQENLANNLRTLVCLDFPYGYPKCICSSVISGGPVGDGQTQSLISHRLSADIEDGFQNQNNRFQVASNLNSLLGAAGLAPAFWGRPVTQNLVNLEHLSTTKPAPRQGLPEFKEYRDVELLLRQSGRRAFPVWQLFGNGSVGSQTLLGLPILGGLRNHPDLIDASTIWPFDSGWVTSFPEKIRIVHAEFWPGALPVDIGCHPVRDAAQVISAVHWAASQDSDGNLGRFFDPLANDHPSRETALIEGWILGFPPL